MVLYWFQENIELLCEQLKKCDAKQIVIKNGVIIIQKCGAWYVSVKNTRLNQSHLIRDIYLLP